MFDGDGAGALYGGVGSEVLIGGNTSDTMFGDTCSHQLIAGTGNDLQDGGAGADGLRRWRRGQSYYGFKDPINMDRPSWCDAMM